MWIHEQFESSGVELPKRFGADEQPMAIPGSPDVMNFLRTIPEVYREDVAWRILSGYFGTDFPKTVMKKGQNMDFVKVPGSLRTIKFLESLQKPLAYHMEFAIVDIHNAAKPFLPNKNSANPPNKHRRR